MSDFDLKVDENGNLEILTSIDKVTGDIRQRLVATGHGGFPDYPRTDILKNGDLDIRANEWGITSRKLGETDAELRARIRQGMLNHQRPISDPHEGHEVIENYAGGKAFKYCRKCKVEV